MGKKRAADSSPGPELDVEDPPVVEAPEAEPEPVEDDSAEEATSTVTFKGKASAVQKAAGRLGVRQAPPGNGKAEAEDDGTYDDNCGELMADGRNKLVITRAIPTRYQGLRVRPIRVEFDCPVTIQQLEGEVFEAYGGKVFRVAVYPNTPMAENKQPLGVFNLTNPEVDEPWEPEDEGGRAPLPEQPASDDPYSKQDRSPGGTAKRVLAEEAEHLESEINVKRLRRTLKQVESQGDDDRPLEKDPADDRVRQLEEKIAMRDIESRMDKKLEAVLAAVERTAQPRGSDPMIEMMKMMSLQAERSSQQFMTMMTTMVQVMKQPPKEDAFESLEKIARLKSLFGGDNDRINDLMTLAVERMLDGDEKKGGAADESDIRYAIDKLEPLAQKLFDKKIEDGGKPKADYTLEQIKALQLEAAQKAAKELEAKWAAEGKVLKLEQPALPGPAQPKPPGTPPPGGQPKPQGERDMTNVPPAPGEAGYDRKRAVDFVLDTAIIDIKRGCPENSYLPWDIADGLDGEILEQFAKVTTGAELDVILSAWGDPAKIAEVKKLGQDGVAKSWLTRIVTTAQDFIVKKKAGILK